jgi:hypothetical protein
MNDEDVAIFRQKIEELGKARQDDVSDADLKKLGLTDDEVAKLRQAVEELGKGQ